MRESLRHSWNDGRSRVNAKSFVVPSAVDRPRHVSPDNGSASFLTEASIIEDDNEETPASTDLSGKPGDDGRIMHRMPMVLEDLDYVRFQQAGKERRKVKVKPKEKNERVGVDRRVRELQPETKKDVRPIKDFLPLPMRVGGAPESANQVDGPAGVDESVIEDISFAEFTHVEPTNGGTEDQAIPDRTDDAPRLLLDGSEVIFSSPIRGDPEPVAVMWKRQLARRRIDGDEERHGALYDIIPEVRFDAEPSLTILISLMNSHTWWSFLYKSQNNTRRHLRTTCVNQSRSSRLDTCFIRTCSTISMRARTHGSSG